MGTFETYDNAIVITQMIMVFDTTDNSWPAALDPLQLKLNGDPREPALTFSVSAPVDPVS